MPRDEEDEGSDDEWSDESWDEETEDFLNVEEEEEW